MTADTEPDDGDGEALVVEAHAVDVARGRRRHPCRRAEQRNNGAGLRVAPNLEPGEGVVAEHNEEPDQGVDQRAIVLEPILGLLAGGRRRDHALLPGRRHREPVLGRQRSRGAEHDPAGLLLDNGGVLVARSLRAGVERRLPERHLVGDRDACLGLIDGERPAVAGGVPVELIVTLEEADLARGAISDDVFMLPAREYAIGAADARPHTVGHPLAAPDLGLAIARDRTRYGSPLRHACRRALCRQSGNRARCRGGCPGPRPRPGWSRSRRGRRSFEPYIADKTDDTLDGCCRCGGDRYQQQDRDRDFGQP